MTIAWIESIVWKILFQVEMTHLTFNYLKVNPSFFFLFKNIVLIYINLYIYSGLREIILTEKDADFMVNHPVAKEFHKWISKGGGHPEEHYFSSLIRIKDKYSSSPVRFPLFFFCPPLNIWKQSLELLLQSKVVQDMDSPAVDYFPLMARYSIWSGNSDGLKCHGENVRDICNFATNDLYVLYNQIFGKKRLTEKPLTLNKFKLEVDSLAPFVHFQKVMFESFKPLGKSANTELGEFTRKLMHNSLLL